MTQTTDSPLKLSTERSQANSPRLYLLIADKLAQNIAKGELNPGDRLPAERDLAQHYDVSRQTVREALIALEVSGLVEIQTGIRGLCTEICRIKKLYFDR